MGRRKMCNMPGRNWQCDLNSRENGSDENDTTHLRPREPDGQLFLVTQECDAEIVRIENMRRTRQVERRGGHITIAVPDEATRLFLEAEYIETSREACWANSG